MRHGPLRQALALQSLNELTLGSSRGVLGLQRAIRDESDTVVLLVPGRGMAVALQRETPTAVTWAWVADDQIFTPG